MFFLNVSLQRTRHISIMFEAFCFNIILVICKVTRSEDNVRISVAQKGGGAWNCEASIDPEHFDKVDIVGALLSTSRIAMVIESMTSLSTVSSKYCKY
jgi:hypothetical protein